MTTGPIEFLSDSGPAHELDDTEFGGADGLIQPENAQVLLGDPEASGGHSLETGTRETVAEVSAIMARRALTPLDVVKGKILDPEVAAHGSDAVDPVTGRQAPATINKASSGDGRDGELSDLQPF